MSWRWFRANVSRRCEKCLDFSFAMLRRVFAVGDTSTKASRSKMRRRMPLFSHMCSAGLNHSSEMLKSNIYYNDSRESDSNTLHSVQKITWTPTGILRMILELLKRKNLLRYWNSMFKRWIFLIFPRYSSSSAVVYSMVIFVFKIVFNPSPGRATEVWNLKK